MITIESVTKKYGAFTAVDAVSFPARSGRVTGFLGPNGAGKSPTMRIIVGLPRANSGTAMISGRHYVDLPNPGLEVGVLLDASAQHAGRTGREILTIAQQFMGLPRNRVEEMLEVVSLTPNEASRRVRNYSLGMRQRLGIATALIGDPEVLALDEPANGLDPAGIRWMRDLLRGYADRGGTVLLSSHLLHEIEVIADDIVMIGLGRIVSMGTNTELLHEGGTVVAAADLPGRDHPAVDRDPRRHQRVEPTYRAHDVHPRAAPQPDHHREGDLLSGHRHRSHGDRVRGRSARQPDRRLDPRLRPRLGRQSHAVRVLRARHGAQPAHRLHARRALPRLHRRHRRL